jgi:hypothetical protein
VILCARFVAKPIKNAVLQKKMLNLVDERGRKLFAERESDGKMCPGAEKVLFAGKLNMKLRKTIDKCWDR